MKMVTELNSGRRLAEIVKRRAGAGRDALGELISRWVSDEPQYMPTRPRGLRRRRHLRQPNFLADAARYE